MIFHDLRKLEIWSEYTLSWDKCAKRKMIHFDTHYNAWQDNIGHYWTDYGVSVHSIQMEIINGDPVMLKLLLCSEIDRLVPL